MYLLYVDESGDTGLQNSPTDFFVLNGLVVHELRWHGFLDDVIAFRRHLQTTYALKLRQEIHAAPLLSRPGALASIPKHVRLLILREVLDFVAAQPGLSILSVVVDKRGKAPGTDVFDMAWQTLLQRFENTISHRNFPGPQNAQDHGLLIADNTDGNKLKALSRRMRRFNPIPNLGGGGYRQLPAVRLIEDPVHRDSAHSYPLQLVDVVAYFLHQRFRPNSYIRQKGARLWFNRLQPVLCVKASRTDPQGIVLR